MYQGRKKIKEGSCQYKCADRLSLILIAHDVEQILNLATLELSAGQGRKTAAFMAIAKSLSMPVKDVKKDYKKSRNYMLLLKGGGPGSVLELGSGVSNLYVFIKPANGSPIEADDNLLFRWEKELIKQDVDFLLDYQRSKLPKVNKRAQELNAIALWTIVDGLIIYGWKPSELAAI